MTDATDTVFNPITGWDLHCHTICSDGTKTPTELVREASQSGLHGAAITDHDTSEGWDEARAASLHYHVPLLFGTEVTAQFGKVSVHVLAYQYNRADERVSELFERTRNARIDRAKAMVASLSKDFPITWDAVMEQAKRGERTTVGRPHIADALVAAGVYRNRSEAFAGVVSSSSPYYIPTASPDAGDVVQVIAAAGGVSVIAHPGDRSRNCVLLSDSQIRTLAHMGLGGLEVRHRGNDETQRRRLLELAHRYGLLVTGGSDWHGDGKPNLLGENLTDDRVVEMILEKSAKAR
ncbi:PHP domain-containing protein [Bifidobacterium bombi]|uniref:PHP domain containing protein n=1 Tax=Bifidobacterium bombi DSM 19703 TaxID=1341695 RepID=A0A080N5U3_9BIFI|nr:PHP domain-containing protein [Bifidobacterium bombi]KFF31004.1 PHP domain containing protein [Bifidobacterium bombi DSM 19703]